MFVNPTTHMHAAAPDYPIPDPVDITRVRAAVDGDDQPARALIAALLTFHAIRVLDLRAMHTTDIRDGRLRIDRRTILLAAPVRACLAAYLDYRNTTWAKTNPHLFISWRSATHTRPVNTNWFRDTLGIPPQAHRRVRVLVEAIATGGDLRQLTDMFDMHVTTTYRYTQIADRVRTAERAHPA